MQTATDERKTHQRPLSARVWRQEEAPSTIQRPLSARQPRASTPAQPPAHLRAPESTRLDVGAVTGAVVAPADVPRPCSARKEANCDFKAQPMSVTTPRDTGVHAPGVDESPAPAVKIVSERAASPHVTETPPSARVHSHPADNNEGPATPRPPSHRPGSAHPTHEEPASTTPRVTPRRPCSARPAITRPMSMPAASTTPDARLHQRSAAARRACTPLDHGANQQISARPQEQIHITPHPPPLPARTPLPPQQKHREKRASAWRMDTTYASASAARVRSARDRDAERSTQRAAQKAVAAAVAAADGSRKGSKAVTQGQQLQVAVQVWARQHLVPLLSSSPPQPFSSCSFIPILTGARTLAGPWGTADAGLDQSPAAAPSSLHPEAPFPGRAIAAGILAACSPSEGPGVCPGLPCAPCSTACFPAANGAQHDCQGPAAADRLARLPADVSTQWLHSYVSQHEGDALPVHPFSSRARLDPSTVFRSMRIQPAAGDLRDFEECLLLVGFE